MAKFHYDKKRADIAVEFISNLHHTKGKWAGQKFKLEKWQEDILRKLFGLVDGKGIRQYSTLYLEIPRKNGKTFLASAIASYMLFYESRFDPEAEIYSAACDRNQASIVFRQAASIIRKSNILLSKCNIIDSQKTITHIGSGSFYRAIPAEESSSQGFNSSCVVVDELHTQKNRHLVDALITSFGAREQPLTIFLTTAGVDENSICWEYHEYARQVIEGVIDDPTFLGIIYSAADQKDWDKVDWQDNKAWKRANPNLGISVNKEFLKKEARKAKTVPAYQNTFKRLYLNIWTAQDERVIDMSVWEENRIKTVELTGVKCYGGLDLSTRQDITAFVLVFALADGSYFLLPRFWLPKEGLREKVNRDRVPYDQWVKQGLISLTEGNIIDYRFVREEINALKSDYAIQEIAFDDWGSPQIIAELTEDGFAVAPMRQGYKSMSAPTKEMLALLAGKKLHHDGNAVLRWMADCMSVSQDPAGNIKPVKPDRRSSSKRIDGMVAAIMGIDRAIRQKAQGSVYDERGIRTV